MRYRPALLLVTVAVAVLVAAGASAGAAPRCPATFTVLHDDRVGTLAIPQGAYRLRPEGISCATAARLLRRFLADFDGALPGGWTTAPTGRGFVDAPAGTSFTLHRATATPAGAEGRCPGTFTVEHDDRIGALHLRAGRYAIRTRRLSCAAAASDLAFFLFHDSAGTLPTGWRLRVAHRRFVHRHSSFTLTFAGRRERSGGGLHPNRAITCPGTVRLASGTVIGSLVVPAGRYYVNVFSDLSCRRATRRFERFAAAGALPPAWVVEPETGTFLRGNEGFQVEPAS